VRVVLNVLQVLSGVLGWLTIAVALHLAHRLGRRERPAPASSAAERPEPQRPAGVPGAGPRSPAGGLAVTRRC
jgi:uncharacterized membrane protein